MFDGDPRETAKAVYVHPSDRLSTNLLRLLDRAGPQTLDQIVAALGLDAKGRQRASAMLRNFRSRSRVVVAERIAHLSGRPAVWAISEPARAALATGKGRPRVPGAGRRRFGPRAAPKRLAAGPVRGGSFPTSNPLWRAAADLVGRRHSPDVREDLIADLVLAQLEGETDLRAAFKRLCVLRNRSAAGFVVVSLDQTVPGSHDGARTYLDSLPSDCERF